MNLLPTIKKINNQFISLFAIFDKWCDDCLSSEKGSDAQPSVQYMDLREFLITNQYVLILVARVIHGQIDQVDVVEVPSSFREQMLSEFDDDPFLLRKKLRDQLFRLLCFFDFLETKETPTSGDVMAQAVGLFQRQVKQGFDTVEKYAVKL